MNILMIRRRASAIEVVGRWFALALGLSALTMLLSFQLTELFGPTPDAQARSDAYFVFLQNLAGTIPVILVVAGVQPFLPDARSRRWSWLAIVVPVAVTFGWWAQSRLVDLCGCGDPTAAETRAIVHWLAVLAVTIAALCEYRHAFLSAAESLHRAEVERVRQQSELAEGRLQLLQAQIEPHFLFNSLANVRRLLRTDGSAGRAMLADLLRYLESALPRLRDDAPTLEREMEVVRAFLGVHQVRMGSRLHVEFDMPAELGQRVVPPMMLLTLVENALKHGLQPLLEGGCIRVGASSGPTSWRVLVADTGRGLGTSLGSGTGLANIRARLRSMYGSSAELSLRVNEPRGVVATIELPLAPA